MNLNYFIWIEIQANKETIVDPDKFRQRMEQCQKAGIGSVILSVKDTSGFVIYNSNIAPHYCEYDEAFERKDYLYDCIKIIHGLGMKFYASFDVFAEGNKRKKHPMMPGIKNPAWQTSVYGLNEAGEGIIQPVSLETPLKAVGSIDDFGEIFVNPANDDVCAYELSLLNEVMVRYPIDGISLDRVRYVGLSSDFSPITKLKWDEHIGKPYNWPEDIYRIIYQNNETVIQYGKYFGEFITFRSGIIKNFIAQVRKLVDTQKNKIEFWDYTGSWYPLYYQVGANWASKTFETEDYYWVDSVKYMKTGYAEQLDGLLSGFYYPNITEQDAILAGQPAYWYSVEGSGRIASEVTRNVVPIIGSLFLEQYRDNLESMTKAVDMCFQKSAGCMLFDLSYLVNNDWWKYVTIKNDNKNLDDFKLEPLKEDDLTEFTELWRECFTEEFLFSKEKFRKDIFEDELLYQEASLCLRSKENNELIGAIVCKKSKEEDELCPNSCWITALLVKPFYHKLGFGTILYKTAELELKKKSVNKIYVGQDYQNLFSGIPAPSVEKINFFKELGFTINIDEHYDLEADIICNDKIDNFNTSPFDEQYIAQALKPGEDQELYDFLEEEFPGRWLFTAKEHLEAGGSPENIVVLKNQEYNKIKGFCMVAVNNDRTGGLGPIGIAKSIRGKNNGDFLVQQSLLHLRKLGAERICIDWTMLKDFYGKFDFIPVRVYRGAYKEIKN